MSEIQCAIPKNQNLLKEQYLKFKVATYSGTILYELGNFTTHRTTSQVKLLTGPPSTSVRTFRGYPSFVGLTGGLQQTAF